MKDIIAAECLKGKHINLANLSDEPRKLFRSPELAFIKRINLIFRDDVR